MQLVTVLELENGTGSGVFRKFLHRMKRRSLHARVLQCPAGGYMMLTAYSGQPDWDKIAAQVELASHAGQTGRVGHAGLASRAGLVSGAGLAARMARGSRTVVLPRTLTLPVGCPAVRFAPEALALMVLRNTAVRVIRACRIPLYRKAVTLVDPGALYTDFVRELLCHCITVKVVTKELGRYAAVSAAMMEELGAGIVYADSPSLCGDSMLVISPRPEDAAALCTKAPVLTAGEPLPCLGCRLVGAPELRLGAEWVLPRGIAALDLLGAFYEQGSLPEGNELAAAFLRCGSRNLTVQDIAGYIEQNHPFLL